MRRQTEFSANVRALVRRNWEGFVDMNGLTGDERGRNESVLSVLGKAEGAFLALLVILSGCRRNHGSV